jgi:hypothetical protein
MNTWVTALVPKGAGFDFTAGQLLDLIGWGAITLLAIVALIRAATRLAGTIRAAETGVTWPAVTHVMSVAAAWYLSGQIPGPGSWNSPITSTYALLCDTVTSLALLAHFAAVLVLLPLVGLALYALVRWSLTAADPSRWGPLTRSQVVLLSVRWRVGERRLAEKLGTRTTGPTASWWGSHTITPPVTAEELPTVATWFMTDTAVADLAALHRVALAAPLVSGVDLSPGDSDNTRLRIEWDVKALAGIHDDTATGKDRSATRTLWGRHRATPPAPVIPAHYTDGPLGSPS